MHRETADDGGEGRDRGFIMFKPVSQHIDGRYALLLHHSRDKVELVVAGEGLRLPGFIMEAALRGFPGPASVSWKSTCLSMPSGSSFTSSAAVRDITSGHSGIHVGLWWSLRGERIGGYDWLSHSLLDFRNRGLCNRRAGREPVRKIDCRVAQALCL